MIVRFVKNDMELASRFYDSFAPNVGDEVIIKGYSYTVVSRKLDAECNEVTINLGVKV